MHSDSLRFKQGGIEVALSRLVLIRWGIAAAEILTVYIAGRFLGIELPTQALFALILTLLLSNCLLLFRLSSPATLTRRLIGGVLLVDTSLLTALLYYSGGVVNPFTVLYLLYITLAAVILSPLWSYLMAGVSSACFGALFLAGSPVVLDHSHHMHGGSAFSLHLIGMWIAFTLTSFLIAYFISDLARALSKKEEKIQEMRLLTAKQEGLASLTTLAAGAAHELATPLSTIALVAKELERSVGAADREDTTLIRTEVERCREIVTRMSGRVGDDDREKTNVTSFTNELVARIPVGSRERLIINSNLGREDIPLPPSDLLLMLSSLIKNSFEAMEEKGEVHLFLEEAKGNIYFTVVDSGHGIPPEVISRVGEPFFTTKEPGKGMGLGVFLVRLTAERLGGNFEIASGSGGTSVKISIPLNRINNERTISSRS